MHVGALMLLERGKLGKTGGGVDIEKFRKGVEGVLHQVPRFRRFFIGRGLDPARSPVTSSVPVNIRTSDDPALGNQVSAWMVDLPIDEGDAASRLQRVMKIAAHLKDTDQTLAARAQDGLADTFVTNIPGPQFPLYLFGARRKAMLPQVPLLRGMALAIGLMSYDGNVCWGLTADSKLVPDLPQFREALIEPYEEICTAHGVELDRDALASRTWR